MRHTDFLFVVVEIGPPVMLITHELPVGMAEIGIEQAESARATFGFCLKWLAPSKTQTLEAMGIRFDRLLHGEEHFTYHVPIYAGDTITFQTTVKDIYDKKDGALEFLVSETTATNQRGELVQKTRSTAIMQNR